MARSRRWTAEEKALLRSLRGQGLTAKECGERLGRSESSILHALYEKPENRILTGRRKKGLTEKEEAWLVRHFRNTKNRDIAMRLGISHHKLHRLARRLGLTKTKHFVRKTQEEAQQKAKASHLANGTYPPKGFRIPRSRECGFQKGVTPEQRLGKKRNRQRIEKSAEKRRATIRSERRRILFGFEQRTKMRLVRQSSQKINYRLGLRKQGYVEDANDHNVYYYTPDTRRGAVRESHAPMHNIKIYPMP